MIADDIKLGALIAHYGHAQAAFDEWRASPGAMPFNADALAEFICESESYLMDSGSEEDLAACAQIDRLAPKAASYILGDWLMHDYFGPDASIEDMRQRLDYGEIENAANARELQYAQLLLALAEYLGADEMLDILDDKALGSMRADLIAGKLDAWIYWGH